MYGGSQNLFGAKVRKSGCGMIAACDMILFLKGRLTPTFAEYAKFAEDFRDSVAYRRTSNPIGISPYRLAKMITSRTDKKFTFSSRLKFTEKTLRSFIEKSLRCGVPVIVRVGANGKSLPYEITYPASGNRSSEGKMSWHYITVTGISDSGMLAFSSWGGIGKMRCSDLKKHFGITGGLIHPFD